MSVVIDNLIGIAYLLVLLCLVIKVGSTMRW